MIVMKFGGTSVESASAIERVAGIVGAYAARRPLVVVSAMGKTTNKLLAAAEQAAAGDLDAALGAAAVLQEFHSREASLLLRSEDRPAWDHFQAAQFAELRQTLGSIADDGELSPPLWDEICSYGERLSSFVVTLAFRALGLDAEHADARQYLVTDSRHTQAQPLYGPTYERFATLAPSVERRIVVMGGFIGSSPDGVTTTLGRGGSDFSASIAGAGIGAEEIQIWTDVDGMLTCDPRILPGGHLIRRISFSEAAELAYFGAKILHPATVFPAIEKNIPVRVLNSRRPSSPGTLVAPGAVSSANPVKSIACKKGITVVNIQSMRMLMAHGFLRRIFEVFDRYRTAVDMVSTSEVSVSLTIDHDERLPEIIEELDRIAQVDARPSQAIVCLVGDAIRETPGVLARVFGAVSGVNVRMVSQGASLRNISFVVDEPDLERAVAALHAEFFATLDPEVFGEAA
jgi:aspartate kinase